MRPATQVRVGPIPATASANFALARCSELVRSTMTGRAPSNPMPQPLWKTAWFLSCVIHVATAVALGVVIDRSHGGSAGNSEHAIGIVLDRNAVGDRLSEVEFACDSSSLRDGPTAHTAGGLGCRRDRDATGKSSKSATVRRAISCQRERCERHAVRFWQTAGRRQLRAVEWRQDQCPYFRCAGRRHEVCLRVRSLKQHGRRALAAAKQQLTESLNSLDSIHQFQIVFFNHLTRTFDATGGGHRVAFATGANKQLAAKFVGGITADGGTDRLAALRAAIAMQPDVIFFLTDDDDPMPESELAEVNQLNRRSNAAICTIQFGSGPPKSSDNFLVELAKQTGGQYGYVDTTKLSK